MSIKSDKWIKKMSSEHDMISPFTDEQIETGTISYGVSSYGYDIRVADEYKIFTVAIDGANVHGCRISPNIFTTTEELDSLVNAVTELSQISS